ncbi:hypothetical protein D1007_01683 [Hordeum vulgare]|nr:hypothetical protein D1007_01683 [Hordeum vulgare]
MYGMEAYVEFRSQWRAARARGSLDSHALNEGCCFLAFDVIPPIYTTITMSGVDELPHFFDGTPYTEWLSLRTLPSATTRRPPPAANSTSSLRLSIVLLPPHVRRGAQAATSPRSQRSPCQSSTFIHDHRRHCS